MNLWLAAPALGLAVWSAPAMAQHHQHEPPPPAQQEGHQHEPEPTDHRGHDMGDHSEHMAGGASTSALGPYPMGRDASGTAWQPDVSEHGGIHEEAGPWTLMGHVQLNGVYAWSDGPRGDEKAFIAGMIMGAARRDIGERGTLNLRAMLSPEPFMGANGYPLLFAAGESANGVDPLVDRQHPHDLFMELSASYAHRMARTLRYSCMAAYRGRQRSARPLSCTAPQRWIHPKRH